MSVCALSCVWLCDPMHDICQAPLSMGFPRKEYWSGLPFPSPGVLPNSRIKPTSLGSPALAGGLFTTTLPRKLQYRKYTANNIDNIILILQVGGSNQWINSLITSGQQIYRWKWKWSRVQLFSTPRTVAHQSPLSMGFSRQDYWSGLPFPSPGDLPDPGTEPRSPTL